MQASLPMVVGCLLPARHQRQQVMQEASLLPQEPQLPVQRGTSPSPRGLEVQLEPQTVASSTSFLGVQAQAPMAMVGLF